MVMKKWYLPGTGEELDLDEITMIIDCGGSGTTLSCGLLPACIAESKGRAITITGDSSLRKRPRTALLNIMRGEWAGHRLAVSNKGCAPITILPYWSLPDKNTPLGRQLKCNILKNLRLINKAVLERQESMEAKEAVKT